jgi:hypothetical protein
METRRSRARGFRGSAELALLVERVLAAELAELLLLELVGGLRPLVGRVPTVLAVLTDEEDVAFLDLHVAFLGGILGSVA